MNNVSMFVIEYQTVGLMLTDIIYFMLMFFRFFCNLHFLNASGLCGSHFAVIPTAIATALDVNLSNESLVFISVTFATMVRLSTELSELVESPFLCIRLISVNIILISEYIYFWFSLLQCKSASPIFLLVFAFVFR